MFKSVRVQGRGDFNILLFMTKKIRCLKTLLNSTFVIVFMYLVTDHIHLPDIYNRQTLVKEVSIPPLTPKRFRGFNRSRFPLGPSLRSSFLK